MVLTLDGITYNHPVFPDLSFGASDPSIMASVEMPCILCPVKTRERTQENWNTFIFSWYDALNLHSTDFAVGTTGKHPFCKLLNGNTLVHAEFLCLNKRQSTCDAHTDATFFPVGSNSKVSVADRFKTTSCRYAKVPFATPFATSELSVTMYGALTTQ